MIELDDAIDAACLAGTTVNTDEWKTLAGWMQRAGLGDAPRTLLEEFAKIKSGDVVLQAQAREGGPSRTIWLRYVPEPDAALKVLLSRLGLILPRRLRQIDEDAQALTTTSHGTNGAILASHTSRR